MSKWNKKIIYEWTSDIDSDYRIEYYDDWYHLYFDGPNHEEYLGESTSLNWCKREAKKHERKLLQERGMK